MLPARQAYNSILMETKETKGSVNMVSPKQPGTWWQCEESGGRSKALNVWPPVCCHLFWDEILLLTSWKPEWLVHCGPWRDPATPKICFFAWNSPFRVASISSNRSMWQQNLTDENYLLLTDMLRVQQGVTSAFHMPKGCVETKMVKLSFIWLFHTHDRNHVCFCMYLVNIERSLENSDLTQWRLPVTGKSFRKLKIQDLKRTDHSAHLIICFHKTSIRYWDAIA
jgi:hypothetical protein